MYTKCSIGTQYTPYVSREYWNWLRIALSYYVRWKFVFFPISNDKYKSANCAVKATARCTSLVNNLCVTKRMLQTSVYRQTDKQTNMPTIVSHHNWTLLGVGSVLYWPLPARRETNPSAKPQRLRTSICFPILSIILKPRLYRMRTDSRNTHRHTRQIEPYIYHQSNWWTFPWIRAAEPTQFSWDESSVDAEAGLWSSNAQQYPSCSHRAHVAPVSRGSLWDTSATRCMAVPSWTHQAAT